MKVLRTTGLRYGLGKHLAEIPKEHGRNFFIVRRLVVATKSKLIIIKCFYVLQLAYVATLPLVKISVLLFYYRIFPQKRFRYALYGMGTFLVLFFLSSVLAVVLQCLPIHAFWEPDFTHHCFDQVTFYIAQGSLNFVSDVFVVLMPIPLLWKLRLPLARRVGLVIVFLLGGL